MKQTTLCSLLEYIGDMFNLEVVLHIPHASTELPSGFYDDLDCLDHQKRRYIDLMHASNIKMSDVLLLDRVKDYRFKKVIAKYSRLYVDVEKYWDDSKEEMSKYGMGAIYRKDIYGNPIHKCTDTFRKEAKKYYDDHHKLLKDTVESCKKDVLLIDLHSFSDEMANVFSSPPYPDVCIGYDTLEDKQDIVDLLKRYFLSKNLSIRENYPYKGSISINKTNKKAISIMLEINKRIYL